MKRESKFMSGVCECAFMVHNGKAYQLSFKDSEFKFIHIFAQKIINKILRHTALPRANYLNR